MNKREAAKSWYLPWRTTPAPRTEDPADLGTAFGLDLTLEAEEADRAAARMPSRRPGWLQRLSLRRRVAT